ncbi:uncharacterized protein LOC129590478 [Paramacrobiotus metropolitanus]|uniref:uncharacterized protein LOC129590478 n=1 Tax=Paramacrobiotus metropolitanus TaxID=2943436 RepID=UPI002445777B|nr:uncharacterized protein LOC129590478 [Paramacrobiotus metropolitanus]XP_055341709.1 uncharacterized protein LOC129590478 [Paramacrobiotus metropolitanus]
MAIALAMTRIVYTPAIVLLSLSAVSTRSTGDLLDIYRQQLDHDLRWDDNVDGSYDIDTIRTKFRTVSNGLGWIMTSTPLSTRNAVKNIHQEMPLYQFYNHHTQQVTSTTDAPEVEIVLGKEDDEDDNEETDNGNDSDNDSGDSDEDNEDTDDEVTTKTTPATTEATTPPHLVIQPGRAIDTAPARLAHNSAHLPAPTYDLAKCTDVEDHQTEQAVTHLAVPITVGVVGSLCFAGVIAFFLQRRARGRKASFDEEHGYGYGYGISQPIPSRKPSKGLTLDLTNDRLLAKSAETYHYQQQRRSMISSSGSSSRSGSLMHGRVPEHSDYDTEEEEADEGVATQYGDYTVFECPGLAAPGEFEVVNPLFADQNESVIEVVSSED